MGLEVAVWHIHHSAPPPPEPGVSFGVLPNLVRVCHSDDPRVIWHYLTRYVPAATPETAPLSTPQVPPGNHRGSRPGGGVEATIDPPEKVR
jgi:lysyl-tRNA synthetase class I